MKHFLAAAALAAVATAPAALAQSDAQVRACQQLALRANDAIAARDVDALAALYWEAPDLCGTVIQGELLDRLYLTAIAAVREGIARGDPVAGFEPVLAHFENYPADVSARSHPGRRLPTSGMPWRLHYYLGLLRQSQHQYREAAFDFGQAFRASQDVSVTPAGQEAGGALEIDMLQRQQEMMLAAGNYTSAASSRGQVVDIVSRPVLRSDVEVRFVTLPIWFEFGEPNFTPEGLDAAEYLAAGLSERAQEPILIVAHTDERGSDSYNLALSEARAETLRAFLVERGYPGQLIATEGRGESCPYLPSDPSLYDASTEEGLEMLYRLDRRAEIVWPERQDEPGGADALEEPRCRH